MRSYGRKHHRVYVIFVLKGIHLEHDHVAQRMQLLAGKLEHSPIGLHGNHDCRLRGQKRGQGAGAGADLQHHVGGGQIGRIGQYSQQVQIDQEILPELGPRPDARLLEAPHQKRQSLSGCGIAGHKRMRDER